MVKASHRWRLGSTSEQEINENLVLPLGPNPRIRALGKLLRERNKTDEAVVQSVLNRIQNENYRYTLRPPTVGRNAMDDFFFETRAGFCEYYAGAFVVLMRAAGLPARVVTGYLSKPSEGGEVRVLQGDAHAWAEVWLGDRGWVRFDPTAAIHPSRVDPDAASWQMNVEPSGLLGYLHLKGRRFLTELDLAWREHMTQFDQSQQAELFTQLGLDKASKGLLAIGCLVTLMAAGVLWQQAVGIRSMIAQALARSGPMHTVEKRLAKLGIPMSSGQTWRERLALFGPGLDEGSHDRLREIVFLHEHVVYAKSGDGDSKRKLQRLCQEFRPSLLAGGGGGGGPSSPWMRMFS